MIDDELGAGELEARERGLGAREQRPIIERIGLAAVALVLAILFAGVALASWFGGELFLAAMAAIGAAMTLSVGVLTLIRG